MSAPLQKGDVIAARYHVEEVLAERGFSIVYRCRDSQQDAPVTVKVLRTDRFDPELQRSAAQRFGKEMAAVAALKHPRIVPLIEPGGLWEGQLYWARAYVPGDSLRALLSERGALKPPVAIDVMAQVLEALVAAHDAGIIHQALTPANVLVHQKGERLEAQVLDFGTAAVLDDVKSGGDKQITQITTPDSLSTMAGYMAPEQVAGKGITTATDLYAWGLLFLEVLTGKPVVVARLPIEAVMFHASPNPVPIPAPWAGTELGQLLAGALAKKPAERTSAVETLAALRRIDPTAVAAAPANGSNTASPATAVPPRVDAPSPRTAPTSSRTRTHERGGDEGPNWSLVLLIVLLVVAAAALVFMVSG